MPLQFPYSFPSGCFFSWPIGSSVTYRTVGTITGLTSGTIMNAGADSANQIALLLNSNPVVQNTSYFYKFDSIANTNFLVGENVVFSSFLPSGIKNVNGTYTIYRKDIVSGNLVSGPVFGVRHWIKCTGGNPANNAIYNYNPVVGQNVRDGKSFIYSTVNNTWSTLNVPIGTIMLHSGFTAPNGWLMCNGNQYATGGANDYNALYDALTIQFTANATSGTNTLTNVSSLAGLAIGMPIIGLGITSFSSLSIVNLYTNQTTGNTIVLSGNLSASGTASSYRAVPFGVGTSAGSFRVPNLAGRVPIGQNNPNRILGGSSGEENHTLTSAGLASHSHTISETAHNHTAQNGRTDFDSPTHYHPSYIRVTQQEAGGYGCVISGNFQNRVMVSGYAYDYPGYQQASAQHTHSFSTNYQTLYSTIVGSAGSSLSHNNMQPFLPLNYIIKY